MRAMNGEGAQKAYPGVSNANPGNLELTPAPGIALKRSTRATPPCYAGGC
jgi:hypothetical protein